MLTTSHWSMISNQYRRRLDKATRQLELMRLMLRRSLVFFLLFVDLPLVLVWVSMRRGWISDIDDNVLEVVVACSAFLHLHIVLCYSGMRVAARSCLHWQTCLDDILRREAAERRNQTSGD